MTRCLTMKISGGDGPWIDMGVSCLLSFVLALGCIDMDSARGYNRQQIVAHTIIVSNTP